MLESASYSWRRPCSLLVVLMPHYPGTLHVSDDDHASLLLPFSSFLFCPCNCNSGVWMDRWSGQWEYYLIAARLSPILEPSQDLIWSGSDKSASLVFHVPLLACAACTCTPSKSKKKTVIMINDFHYINSIHLSSIYIYKRNVLLRICSSFITVEDRKSSKKYQ